MIDDALLLHTVYCKHFPQNSSQINKTLCTSSFTFYFNDDKLKTRVLNTFYVLYFHLEYINSKKDEDLSPDPRTPRDQTIECDIQPTDTLSNLSLKYNIPLAELKRVNNIMKVCETCLFIYISNIIIFLIILKSTNAYLTLGKKYQLDWWSLKQILDIFDTIYKTNDNWYNY